MEKDQIKRIAEELEKGMKLPKCKQCGCMKDALETITLKDKNFEAKIKSWKKELEPIKYSCLGCKYCFGASAINLFDEQNTSHCTPNLSNDFVAGEYFITDKKGFVAISTLGSSELAKELSDLKLKNVCIVGKTETENIGIEKVIKNILKLPQIKYLVLSGKEPQGHLTGEAFLSLKNNGVDEEMRIMGSQSRRPFLKNLTKKDIENFRKNIELIDMRNCEDKEIIVKKVNSLETTESCGCNSCDAKQEINNNIEVIYAEKTVKVEMDKAGYFVIIPDLKSKEIIIEHYDYSNKLLRTIKGKNANDIYHKLIQNNWITQHSHSAYIGKELTKAELSIKHKFKYVQD